MGDEITGRGDPLRTMRLLWSGATAPKRGPKPKVSLANIVAAAVAIADREGLEAVSTRRVAEVVGISPMSFYTHVPGKAELLDLMLDAAANPGDTARPTFEPGRWRDNVRFVARSYRAFYLAHPWVLDLATHRPVLGPSTMRAYDLALSALDRLGLEPVEMDMACTMIGNYVYGAVRDVARAKMVKELTGMSDDEWWYAISPFLETIDYAPYPVAARIGPIVGEAHGLGDPDGAFSFGLERLIDGLDVFITRKTAR